MATEIAEQGEAKIPEENIPNERYAMYLARRITRRLRRDMKDVGTVRQDVPAYTLNRIDTGEQNMELVSDIVTAASENEDEVLLYIADLEQKIKDLDLDDPMEKMVRLFLLGQEDPMTPEELAQVNGEIADETTEVV